MYQDLVLHLLLEQQIKKQELNYKIITFFILPPSKSELFNRLKNRDMKDKNIVEERMNQFNEDITHWENYDFVVINDDLQKCYEEIIRFINKNGKTTRIPPIVGSIVRKKSHFSNLLIVSSTLCFF